MRNHGLVAVPLMILFGVLLVGGEYWYLHGGQLSFNFHNLGKKAYYPQVTTQSGTASTSDSSKTSGLVSSTYWDSSPQFGVTFLYSPATMKVTEEGNTAYVSFIKDSAHGGDMLRVFDKEPSEPLTTAIRRVVFDNKLPASCNFLKDIWIENFHVQTATVTTESLGGCSREYDDAGTPGFFFEESTHPDKFYFIQFGSAFGSSTDTVAWRDTLITVSSSTPSFKPAPVFAVTMPTKDQAFAPGDTMQIKWGKISGDEVQLALSNEHGYGVHGTFIGDEDVPNTGTYDWHIPTDLDVYGKFTIKVFAFPPSSESSKSYVTATSSVFSILPLGGLSNVTPVITYVDTPVFTCSAGDAIISTLTIHGGGFTKSSRVYQFYDAGDYWGTVTNNPDFPSPEISANGNSLIFPLWSFEYGYPTEGTIIKLQVVNGSNQISNAISYTIPKLPCPFVDKG